MIEIRLIGAVNNPGIKQIDESISFKELLEKHGDGMLRKYPRPIVMQVGGPLGTIVRGSRINDRVREHTAEIRTARMVAFFGERFCPVDFLRFVTRFLIQEVHIDTPHVRAVNGCIEDIASGRSDELGIDSLRELAAIRGKLSYGEYRLNAIIDELLDIFGDDFVEHAVGKYCHFSICRLLFHRQAPCSNTCPSNMDVPGYIELIKHDRLEDAYTLMKQDNPLSFVCGKICPAPCESRCRQGDISEVSVAIRQLKRYIADDRVVSSTEYIDDRLPPNGKSVAVVGGGPAGISAAYYLVKSGYEVTLYEANDRLGGMLAYGIPAYRLPMKDVKSEVAFLPKMGVKVMLNTLIGDDIPLSQLRSENDVVLLASGRWVGRNMGPSSPQIEPALNFLWDIKLGERTSVPDKVVVIGGGAVAMDAAMSAQRLGADTMLVSLEQREEMLVDEHEVEEAAEDGVKLLNGWSAKDFSIKDGQLRALVLQRCLRVFDDDFRFAPEFDPNELKEIGADLVIMAVGQDADLNYLDEDIGLDKRRRVVLDAAFQTSATGVFAAGDIKAPGLVISAVAEGKRAAMSIDSYLDGHGIYFGRDIDIPETRLDPRIWDILREKPEKLSVKERRSNFAEVESTLTRDQALSEANRCLRCDRNSMQELHLRTSPSNTDYCSSTQGERNAS